MLPTDATRLKDPGAENQRLKTTMADLTLDNTMLGETAAERIEPGPTSAHGIGATTPVRGVRGHVEVSTSGQKKSPLLELLF